MNRFPSPTGSSLINRLAAILLFCLLAPAMVHATCGDGIVDGGEACDLGTLNGDDSSCCTTGCELRAGGAVCRPATGICDVADTCDGASPECPTAPGRNIAPLGTATQSSTLAADTQAPNGIDGNTDGTITNGSVTHTDAGSDDWWEVDLGSVRAIEAIRIWNRTDCCDDRLRDFYVLVSDVPFVSGVLADVLVQPGVDAIFHPGAAAVTNDFTVGRTARFVRIQQATNVIHIAEVEVFAESDGKAPAGTECRASAGVCDAADACNGFDNDCPADLRLGAGSECRAANGGCDSPEVCDGDGVDCPADAVADAGTVCRPAFGACDAAETCDGASAACPPDALQDAGFECRPRADYRDRTDTCDGASSTCPPDTGICSGFFDAAFAGGAVHRGTPGAFIEFEDLAVQTDGSILAVGTISDLETNIALVRYLPDGSPDPGFGANGLVRTSLIGLDFGVTVAVQEDGRIVVTGESLAGDILVRILRYESDGSLDTGFGVAGVTTIADSNDVTYLPEVVPEPDGHLIGVGVGDNDELSLVRLDANGQLDPTFGTSGVRTHDLGIVDTRIVEAVRQPDGRILIAIAGEGASRGNDDFFVVRVHPDGSLDPDFANGGVLTRNFTSRDITRSVLLRPDGRIIVAGEIGDSFANRILTLLGYDANGQLDQRFGNLGTTFVPIAPAKISVADAALLADGTIVTVGTTNDRASMILGYFRKDGRLATEVGDGGFLVTEPIDGEGAFVKAAMATSDGKVVVGGEWGDEHTEFLLARFHGRCEGEAWLGYKAKAPKADPLGVALPDDNQLPAPWSVALEDGLIAGDPDGRENFEVGKAQQILRRAQLHAGPVAQVGDAAFVRYAARPAKEGAGNPVGGTFPKALKHTPRTWDLENEFGTIRVLSKKARAVLVPAAVDLDVSPPAPGSGDPFLCYAVKATKDVTDQTPDGGSGSGKLRRDMQAFVADGADFCALASDGNPAFASTTAAGTCLVDLGKPVELCNRVSLAAAEAPRATNATGVDDIDAGTGDSLLCYAVKLATKVKSEDVATTLGAAIGAKVSPKQTKAPVQSAKAGNPLLTTPGASFPAPLMLDTKGQAVVCLQTQVVDVSELR